MRTAQTLKFPLLQDAQQFGLDFRRNISYFIQEQRALIGELHATDLLIDGACECSLFMPEELALQQASGDGGAIELHKRPIFAPAVFMDGPGDQLLARAGFAEQ